MICPNCSILMTHLNQGGGFSEGLRYQTYDYLECSNCGEVAIEFYHTEFIKHNEIGLFPSLHLKNVKSDNGLLVLYSPNIPEDMKKSLYPRNMHVVGEIDPMDCPF